MSGPVRWRCGKGHVLGWVERNGKGNVLMLLRQALDGEGVEEVDVMALVVGTAVDVRCSVCGDVRTWYEDGGRRKDKG